MSERERKLWPYKPRTAMLAAGLILLILLLVLILLQLLLEWPSPESERTVLLGIFVLSLIPIILLIVDIIIERGGVAELAGVKLDFSQAQQLEVSGLTMPTNIGFAAQPLTDSHTTQILDTLKQAARNESVVIDLEEGKAWWETRLLVLLAGAVRHNRPEIVVFVGNDGGVKQRFLGWGSAEELLPRLLKAHDQYPLSYHAALAASRQWAMVEPTGAVDPAGQKVVPPAHPPWPLSGLAGQHPDWTFDGETGLPNPLYAEQILASDLGSKVESAGQVRAIDLPRLDDLFCPALHKESIDESWPAERQLDTFFATDTDYVAITKKGQFKSLVSRIAVLNAMIGTLPRKKAKA